MVPVKLSICVGVVARTPTDYSSDIFGSSGALFFNWHAPRIWRDRDAMEFTIPSLFSFLFSISFVNMAFYEWKHVHHQNFNVHRVILRDYSNPTLLEVMQNKQLFTMLR